MEWKTKYPKDNKPGEKELLDFFKPNIRDLFIAFDREMNERFNVKNRYYCAEHRFMETVGWIFGYGRNYGCKLLDLVVKNDCFCVLKIDVQDEDSLQKVFEEAQKKYDNGYEERFNAKSSGAKKSQNARAAKHVENNHKKEQITEDTVIVFGKFPSSEYKKFFKKALGDNYEKYAAAVDYTSLYKKHIGKTIKEVINDCLDSSELKKLEDVLSERRFDAISEAEKVFIIAFDKEMNAIGYDYGDSAVSTVYGSVNAIKYGKTGTKSRPCPANIEINENGISLRLFLSKIDKHRQYIENAPTHIKEAFIFKDGDCSGCNLNYCSPKTYTIDGQLFNKCIHKTFRFYNPSVEKLSDYIGLLAEFYPKRK